MRILSYEMNVLVGGRPISEYEHEGHTFVEGRKGSDFEVEFKNKTSNRVLVVPSVDGRSVLDGKPATPDSMGYIVPAWGSIKIPGWTLDGNHVAKFTFADKDQSYAAQTSEGSAVQNGVIGVLVYAEKLPQKIEHHHHHYPKSGSLTHPPVWPKTPWNIGSPTPLNMSAADVKRAMDSRVMMNSANVATSSADPFEMGTGFGEKMDFKVNRTTFDRGDLVAQMVLYYDSRRNLEKRGIEVVKRETRYLSDLPEAFSGIGCSPPKGWTG